MKYEVIGLENFPIVQEGDSIVELIGDSLKVNNLSLQEKDVIVIAHTIISRAEGYSKRLDQVMVSEEASKLARLTEKDPRLVQVILDQSSEVVAVRRGLIITRHKAGWVAANSAVDQSNVGNGDTEVIVLPDNPDEIASNYGKKLEAKFGLSDLGVVVSDSMGRALRRGIVNVAIGSYKFPGLLDQRGRTDLFGHELKVTITAPADEAAAAAELLMGQANEGMPVIILRGLEWEDLGSKQNPETGTPLSRPASEIARPDEEMLFGPKLEYQM